MINFRIIPIRIYTICRQRNSTKNYFLFFIHLKINIFTILIFQIALALFFKDPYYGIEKQQR
jgi:hypothetical protein